MPLYFITGNQGKFNEIKSLLPDVEQLDIDLPELQDVDPKAIIKAKLLAAFEHHQGEFIVEDTSLYVESMNGLPGPLVKWFLKSVGGEGLLKMAQALGSVKAEARTIIGYARNQDEMEFFEGVIKGSLVAPRGDKGFGWDPIFLPEGFDQTFAEMGLEQKTEISMRRQAADKLRAFLKR